MSILNFTEAAIIEGTKYRGMELLGYSFSLAILLLPIVFGLVILSIIIQIIWRLIKNKLKCRRKNREVQK